jgi:hypothetical protein
MSPENEVAVPMRPWLPLRITPPIGKGPDGALIKVSLVPSVRHRAKIAATISIYRLRRRDS